MCVTEQRHAVVTQARHDLPVDEALRRVRAARPFVAPNPGFLRQLHEFEDTIRRCGREGGDAAADAAAAADHPTAAPDDTASTNGADAEERRGRADRGAVRATEVADDDAAAADGARTSLPDAAAARAADGGEDSSEPPAGEAASGGAAAETSAPFMELARSGWPLPTP